MYTTRLNQYREYLQLRNYSASSIKGQVRQASYFEQALDRGQDYYQELRQRKKNYELLASTYNNYVYCLQQYLNYLEDQDIYHYPTKLLTSKETPVEPSILTVDEIKKLFVCTAKNPKLAERDKAVLVCLYLLGLRAGEAVRLKAEDVDFKQGLVFVSKTKTGYQRLVPMCERAKLFLKAYLSIRLSTSHYVLDGMKGCLQANSLQGLVKRLGRQAGLQKRIYPHLLRHSIASHLLASGMELKEVGRFLGHRNIESTQRYTHILEEKR